MTAAKTLRERAEAYTRDAAALDDEGDTYAAVAYRTIADELRKVAADIEQASDPMPLLTTLTVAVDRYMQSDEHPRPDATWKAMGEAVEAAGEIVYPL